MADVALMCAHRSQGRPVGARSRNGLAGAPCQGRAARPTLGKRPPGRLQPELHTSGSRLAGRSGASPTRFNVCLDRYEVRAIDRWSTPEELAKQIQGNAVCRAKTTDGWRDRGRGRHRWTARISSTGGKGSGTEGPRGSPSPAASRAGRCRSQNPARTWPAPAVLTSCRAGAATGSRSSRTRH